VSPLDLAELRRSFGIFGPFETLGASAEIENTVDLLHSKYISEVYSDKACRVMIQRRSSR
jgi:hypothetical protein